MRFGWGRERKYNNDGDDDEDEDNHSKRYLLCAYTGLRTLQVLINLLLTTLWVANKMYIHPHFTDGDTEHKGMKQDSQAHTNSIIDISEHPLCACA